MGRVCTFLSEGEACMWVMHQLNILLAQEFKFLQSCDARGSYAPSSIIECAYLCCLCPSSSSPTPAPHTSLFPPQFSMGPTWQWEHPHCTKPLQDILCSTPVLLEGPCYCPKPFVGQALGCNEISDQYLGLCLIFLLWTWPPGCSSANMCC